MKCDSKAVCAMCCSPAPSLSCSCLPLTFCHHRHNRECLPHVRMGQLSPAAPRECSHTGKQLAHKRTSMHPVRHGPRPRALPWSIATTPRM